MSLAFGRDDILPLLGDFLEKYPAVLPDWQFENRQVDLVAEGFDAAIGGGVELTPGVVVRTLARIHIIAVASRAYLGRRGRPASPGELAGHDGILMQSVRTGRLSSWPLRNPAGEQAAFQQKPRVVVSDPELMCRVAASGLGIALVPMPEALAYLRKGTLVRVLPDWHGDAGPLSLYYSSQKLLPAKTRAFVDFIVEHFRRQDLAAKFAVA